MDRPPNQKLRVLPRPNISQAKILELVEIDNKLELLAKKRRELYADMLQRHMAGDEVERGFYKLALERELGGGVLEYRLKIC